MPDSGRPAEPGDGRILWALLALALGLRALATLVSPPPLAFRDDRNAWYDPYGYDALAERLAAGEEYSLGGLRSFYPPGYPLFAAALYAIFGPHALPVCLLQYALSALLVLLVYDAGRRLVPTPAATVAALIVAAHPLYLRGAAVMETEAVYAFCVALALWWAVRSRPFLAGLAGGAAVLVRVPGLFPIACLAMGSLFVEPGWKKKLAGTLRFAAGCGMLLLPWAVHNVAVLGTPTIGSTQGAFLLPVGARQAAADVTYDRLGDDYWLAADQPEAERYQIWAAQAWAQIRNDPIAYAKLCYIRAWMYWYPPRISPRAGQGLSQLLVMLGGLLLAMAAVRIRGRWVAGAAGLASGLTGAIWGDPSLYGLQFLVLPGLLGGFLVWRRSLLPLAMAASASAPYILVAAVSRYRLGTEPLLLLVALAGAAWLVGAVRERALRPTLGQALTHDGPVPWAIRGPLLAIGGLLAVGLTIVALRQARAEGTTRGMTSPAVFPSPPEGVLGQEDFELVARWRARNLGHIGPYQGAKFEWIGIVRRPTSLADWTIDDPFRSAASVGIHDPASFFWLRMCDLAGRPSPGPREFPVFSLRPLPPEIRHGAIVRVRGMLAGADYSPFRHLVLRAEDVALWTGAARP